MKSILFSSRHNLKLIEELGITYKEIKININIRMCGLSGVRDK